MNFIKRSTWVAFCLNSIRVHTSKVALLCVVGITVQQSTELANFTTGQLWLSLGETKTDPQGTDR